MLLLLVKTDVHHYPGNNADLGTAARNTKVHTLAGTQVMVTFSSLPEQTGKKQIVQNVTLVKLAKTY